MNALERLGIAAALALAAFAVIRSGPSSTASAAEDPPAAPAPAASDAPRIAVCAAVKIVDEMMGTERFKPAREELEDALRKEKLEPIISEGRDLQKTLEAMPRDDPKFAETRERLVRLQRNAERAGREIAQKVEAKVAEQLTECYALVRASAAAVAEDMGFTFVLSSGDAEDPLKSEMVVQIVRDLLSRPVLVSPKNVDISEDVRRDLKLQ